MTRTTIPLLASQLAAAKSLYARLPFSLEQSLLRVPSRVARGCVTIV